MPTATANGIDLNYVESGQGSRTVVFSHGLLLDHHMFEAQRQALQRLDDDLGDGAAHERLAVGRDGVPGRPRPRGRRERVLVGRKLTQQQRERLTKLTPQDFGNSQTLATAVGLSAAELVEGVNHPRARLRHF